MGWKTQIAKVVVVVVMVEAVAVVVVVVLVVAVLDVDKIISRSRRIFQEVTRLSLGDTLSKHRVVNGRAVVITDSTSDIPPAAWSAAD